MIGAMKVINGIFKRRILEVPAHIRPASSRVKKSVFDLLRGEIEGKIILDLFGGSGALGIEALSLGAKKAVFVDVHRACATAIIRNLSNIKMLSSCRVIVKDSFRAIKDFSRKNDYFDLIFIDPPYYKGMAKKSLKILDEYDILSALGYIVILCYRDDEEGRYEKGELISANRYGQTSVFIYTKRGK